MDGDVAGMLRILGFAFTMIAGGNDTVTGLLGGAAELLTTHPGQRRLLLDRLDMLPAAIEELLRLTSPVQCLARPLTRDTTAHGRRIPGGRKVLLLYGAVTGTPAALSSVRNRAMLGGFGAVHGGTAPRHRRCSGHYGTRPRFSRPALVLLLSQQGRAGFVNEYEHPMQKSRP
jgi:hypothetical protein